MSVSHRRMNIFIFGEEVCKSLPVFAPGEGNAANDLVSAKEQHNKHAVYF